MEIFNLNTNRKIILTDKEFLGSGGEGSIYLKNNLIYKIYHSIDLMTSIGKIRELSSLVVPNAILPVDIIANRKKDPIGFSMHYIKSNVALCKLFSNDFLLQNSISPDNIKELVSKIRLAILDVHGCGCLLIDGNEMNYLLNDKFNFPYFIDTNGWQTPSYPADYIKTPVMPTVRDWQYNVFSELSDWFSFGIVACQLFVGIHPFKGSHPSFKKKDLKGRMLNNVSIFNKDTSIPNAARDFRLIPSAYREWFVRMFEKGERIPPPDETGTIIQIQKVLKKLVNDKIIWEKVRDFQDDVFVYFSFLNNDVCVTEKEIIINNKSLLRRDKEEVLFCEGETVFIKLKEGKISVIYRGKEYDSSVLAEAFFILDNNLFIKNFDKFNYIKIHILNNRVILSVETSWSILPYSTKVYGNFLYSDILGRSYLYIPYKKGGKINCSIVNISELQGKNIIAGKNKNGVVCLKVEEKGRYDLLLIRFDESYKKYDIRKFDDIGNMDIIFSVLDKGVVAIITEDEILELLGKDPYTSNVISIRDKNLTVDVRLHTNGDNFFVSRGREVYKIRMK